MGMTVTEKIIACAANLSQVKPGQIVQVPVDFAFIHDNNAPIAIRQFSRLPNAGIWDSSKAMFVLDHHSPSTTLRAAQHHQNIRDFARKHNIKVSEVGRGVSHPVVAEEGHARPGRIILGTDSHTVGLGTFGCLATGIGSTEMAAVLATGSIWLQVPETIKIWLAGKPGPQITPKDVSLFLLKHFGPSFLNYAAVEIAGPLIDSLDVEERMAITIMCLEMGVKNAIMPVDEKIFNYINGTQETEKVFAADADAVYSSVLHFDLSSLEPLVATPGLPTNGIEVNQVEGVEINQATLGSCSGAFLHDLEAACQVLEGKKVHPGVRFVVVPNSSRVVANAARLGLITKLVEAGAIFSSPACGTCGGYEVGVLGPDETCISTTTRNMDGRMGPGGLIYLASARTVAASAVMGKITDPRKLGGGN
ncbi:MAG: 3-isopropylmalate dehydratase large subunit [Peptococcaceae bacterium]